MLFRSHILLLVTCSAASASLAFAQSGGAPAEPKTYSEALKFAQELDNTREGQLYERAVFEVIRPVLVQALEHCAKQKDAGKQFRLEFYIHGAKIVKVFPEPEQPIAACYAPHFLDIALPSAPAETWVVSVHVTLAP